MFKEQHIIIFASVKIVYSLVNGNWIEILYIFSTITKQMF